MKIEILFEEYKNFLAMLIDNEILREALEELPDDLTLTVAFEKDQPGGVIKDGKLLINSNLENQLKTVAQRKGELDRNIQILKVRVKKIKEELIKELQKEDE